MAAGRYKIGVRIELLKQVRWLVKGLLTEAERSRDCIVFLAPPGETIEQTIAENIRNTKWIRKSHNLVLGQVSGCDRRQHRWRALCQAVNPRIIRSQGLTSHRWGPPAVARMSGSTPSSVWWSKSLCKHPKESATLGVERMSEGDTAGIIGDMQPLHSNPY
eukprot:697352-Prorocentrum_minimum.AAC.2